MPNPSEQFAFAGAPRSIALHGSRSGIPRSTEKEYQSTILYARGGADGKAWNVTIGDGILAEHLPIGKWGWHARKASQWYLSAEFAQPTVYTPISDAQVETFVWWIRHRVLPRFPGIGLDFPSHAEIERRGETGKRDGKDDPFPYGDPRMDDLRARILELL